MNSKELVNLPIRLRRIVDRIGDLKPTPTGSIYGKSFTDVMTYEDDLVRIVVAKEGLAAELSIQSQDPMSEPTVVFASDEDGYDIFTSPELGKVLDHVDSLSKQCSKLKRLVGNLRTVIANLGKKEGMFSFFKDEKISLVRLFYWYKKNPSRVMPLELSVKVDGNWVRCLIVYVTMTGRREKVWFTPAAFSVMDHVKRLAKYTMSDMVRGKVSNLCYPPQKETLSLKAYYEACSDSARQVLAGGVKRR